MSTITMVPVELIDPHPSNPRRDLGDLSELARSIKAQGIRQNLLLVPREVIAGALREDRYTAVIGHRRLAAAKEAGLTEVPAVVDPTLTEAQQIELMLLENIQRSDLSPVEEAEGYQELLDLGVTVAAIAKSTGRKAATIKARVQLLALPDDVREKIHAGQASLLDAAKLAKLDDHPDAQAKVAKTLGTPNFDHVLSTELYRIKEVAEQDQIVEALEFVGVTEAGDGPDDKGLHICRVEKAGDVAGLDIPAGAVYERSGWSACVWLYGPPEHAEAQRAEREAVRRAEQEARDQEAALRQTITEVRSEWIREYVLGKVSAAHRSLILNACVLPRVAGGFVSPWDLGVWLDLGKGHSQKELTEKIAGSSWAKIDPVCWLLIGHHVAQGDWPAGDPGLLALLEALGYVPSDDELALVRPEAEQ
ncbi:MAG: ParB/RepB/Spo0J family partition protein [Thermomicrobiales bacterium]